MLLWLPVIASDGYHSGCAGREAAASVVNSGPSDDFSKERKMLEKLIKDLKQTREELETTDKEWRKKVNTIDQQLVPILPLERVVNHQILLVRKRLLL